MKTHKNKKNGANKSVFIASSCEHALDKACDVIYGQDFGFRTTVPYHHECDSESVLFILKNKKSHGPKAHSKSSTLF